MTELTLVLCIVGAVVVSSFLSRFIPKISTPLVQIVLGAAAAQLPFFPDVTLDPELFMVLFIAPLLYLEARSIDKTTLLKNLKLSLSLAIGLAIATMVAVGYVTHAAWPAVPLAAAFALGAALGPTDAVAVTSLSHEATLSERQRGILKGESLFNDASGIVGFQFSILAAITGTFSVGAAAEEFAVSFFGGALLGLVLGIIANWLFGLMRSFGWETTTSRILMELFLPFLLYLGAEAVGVSGILTVVAAGLIAQYDRSGVGPNVARTNIVSSSVWAVLSFALNGSVFIMLGMMLPDVLGTTWSDPTESNIMLLGIIVLVSTVVVVMRFVWVAAMLRIARDQRTGRRRRMTPERWRSAAIMTFGGPKGTITLSLMFTIPYTIAAGADFPMRDELIFVAAGVIIVTLLLANFLLPLLAPTHLHNTKEMDDITVEVLRQTVEELARRVTPENRRAVLAVIDSYTKRITRLKHRIGSADPQGFEALQIEALQWEKDFLKQRIIDLKNEEPATPAATHQRDLHIEACERMLDQLMTTLRHATAGSRNSQAVSQIRGRFRALQRRASLFARRVYGKILRTTPLMSEDEIYAAVRGTQLEAIHVVIGKLYEQMHAGTYNTEDCSALILDYQRAEASLRNRPNMERSAETINEVEDVKRNSYAIELGIIQDLFEDGRINRAQLRQLRRNVYVMQVDADSGV